MIKPVTIGDAILYNADCMDVLPALGKVDAVITDPPYPDYHVEKYGTFDIRLLNQFNCHQFIFWSAKADFPLDYSAIHIWDKKVGAASQYERIFERKGGKDYRVFNYYLINSTVAASYASDTFFNHPSQKPLRLMQDIIKLTESDIILDPFMGSGTTGVAALKLGRKFIGIEIDKTYFDIAVERISKEANQLKLFTGGKP